MTNIYTGYIYTKYKVHFNNNLLLLTCVLFIILKSKNRNMEIRSK